MIFSVFFCSYTIYIIQDPVLSYGYENVTQFSKIPRIIENSFPLYLQNSFLPYLQNTFVTIMAYFDSEFSDSEAIPKNSVQNELVLNYNPPIRELSKNELVLNYEIIIEELKDKAHGYEQVGAYRKAHAT